MTRPTVHPTTERIYQTLPAFYRAADENQGAGDDEYPLLRYLSLIADQLGAVEDLVDRIDRRPGSDLVDPDTADAAWLPWLAQLVGIRVDRLTEATSFAMVYGTLSLTYATYADLDAAATTYAHLRDVTTSGAPGDVSTTELRGLIANAEAGWAAGSKASVRAAVRPHLTGTQQVAIITHYGGDPWAVRVRTYEAETPDPFIIPGAITRAGVKPAGVSLTHETIAGATYADLSAEFATYTALDTGVGTYEDQRTHVPA